MIISEVQSFIGLYSYYRRYIPFFSDIAQPLYQCSERTPFNWSPAAEKAFSRLKQALTCAPVLGYPNPEEQFILDTDASNSDIGAVLSQSQERVIAYFSRSLNCAKRQYCVTRKELLAMMKSIRHFHCYLYGKSFVLRTDHAALQSLLNFKCPERQLARWIVQLQQYSFDVQHRPGINHGNAQALSRCPCLHQPCEHCDGLESRANQPREHQLSSNTACQASCQAAVIDNNSDIDNWTASDLQHAQEQDKDIHPVPEWLE